MDSLNKLIIEYTDQLRRGNIQKAYRGIMTVMSDLKTYLTGKYPDYSSGALYFGYMDMTYFSFFPETLKNKKLKIAIVFIHDTLSFEIWLAGYNKQIQLKYWKFFKESNWNKYRIPSTIKGADSILECTLVDNPDFSNLEALTMQIESGTLKFIMDVTTFLSENPKLPIVNQI